MTLGTNLVDLADFKNNLVAEGPDFPRRVERRTNGSDMFIGMMVTGKGETFPDIDPCAEDEQPLGILEGYTNKNKIDDKPAGYWYRDGDVPFDDNKWVIIGIPIPGQILWFCSASNTTIEIDDALKIVDGLMDVASTGDQIYATAEEAVVAASSTTKYFRGRVVRG